MSRSSKLFFRLLSAATFYGLFGFVMPKYLAPDAASSIAPAIQLIVAIITVGAIALFLWRFFRTDAE